MRSLTCAACAEDKRQGRGGECWIDVCGDRFVVHNMSSSGDSAGCCEYWQRFVDLPLDEDMRAEVRALFGHDGEPA
jgi:hypothetical protein